jgi:hypothetical protein
MLISKKENYNIHKKLKIFFLQVFGTKTCTNERLSHE